MRCRWVALQINIVRHIYIVNNIHILKNALDPTERTAHMGAADIAMGMTAIG